MVPDDEIKLEEMLERVKLHEKDEMRDSVQRWSVFIMAGVSAS